MPDLADIRVARDRIADGIVRTPCKPSPMFEDELACSLYFKFENLQRTGSFKARGARNRLLQMSADERARGGSLFRAVVLGEVLQAVVGDRAEPASEGLVVALLEPWEGDVRPDIRLLNHVQGIKARAQAPAEPNADVSEQATRDPGEQALVRLVVAGLGAADQICRSERGLSHHWSLSPPCSNAPYTQRTCDFLETSLAASRCSR